MLLLLASPAAAGDIAFTVTMSEPVTVTGTPEIAIDVGGVARAASYRAGSGSNQLTFAYTVQAGDFDADGIAISPSITLAGGGITDLAGNALTSPAFTAPSSINLKVQTYSAAFAGAITSANANAVSFTIDKAPVGGSYSYVIVSSGGAGSVSGSGTVSSLSQTVSGVDVSGLPMGTLTLSVTISKADAGVGQTKTATASPSFAGVLDGVSASQAYSVRRLRAAFTGPLLRVRRSSDDAEQDIGATVAGNLNTAALMSFCGSASCFVRTWYDQSGNARDAMQTTVPGQPRIVDAGVINKVNSRPAIKGDGVDDQMIFALGPLINYPASINLVLAKTSTSERGGWVKLGGSTDAGISIGVGQPPYFTNDGETIIGLKELVHWMPSSTVLAAAATVTFTQGAATNSSAIYQNGTALSLANASSAPLAPGLLTGFLFGHSYPYGGVTQQRFTVNPISEVVLLPSVLSTSARQSLERDQGSYYGITVQ